MKKTNAYKDFQKGEDAEADFLNKWNIGTVENKIDPNDDDDDNDDKFNVMLTSM